MTPIRYHAKTLGEELLERKATPEIAIKSLPSLNLKMHGMHRRRLYVVGARSGMAKTAFVLQIACDMALQGKRVLFVSLESTKSELLERIFCNWFEIDNFELLRGGFSKYETEWEEFQRRLETLPLIVCEGLGKSIPEIRKLFETLEPAPDVIVLDYVQMVSTMGREAITTISEFVKAFRKFCIEKNVAGILVSQLNRDADSVVPTMAQLKGAGCIHPDSIVMGERIIDIVRKKKDICIKSFDIEKQKEVMVKPSHYVHSGKKKCLKIKTQSGKEIILSRGTKLFDGQVWREAKTFLVKEKILVDYSGNKR